MIRPGSKRWGRAKRVGRDWNGGTDRQGKGVDSG